MTSISDVLNTQWNCMASLVLFCCFTILELFPNIHFKKTSQYARKKVQSLGTVTMKFHANYPLATNHDNSLCNKSTGRDGNLGISLRILFCLSTLENSMYYWYVWLRSSFKTLVLIYAIKTWTEVFKLFTNRHSFFLWESKLNYQIQEPNFSDI